MKFQLHLISNNPIDNKMWALCVARMVSLINLNVVFNLYEIALCIYY